ncbi:MAG: tetratricopeptide repeat protein [Bacteroidales bacterium]|nr:tetratricopeptide repeat protein [Bacteroidales bacterium]
MRKWILFVMGWLAGLAMQAQEIDSLYGAFLVSRGEQALKIANKIALMTGDTVGYSSETPLEELNDMLLKSLILWYFDQNKMVEVVNFSHKAIDRFEQQGDLFNKAGCYNILGVAYHRMGRLAEAIDSYELSNALMVQLNAMEENPFYDRSIRYTKNNVASIYYSMGEFDRAEEMYNNCIDMMDQLETDGDFRDMATYLQNLADVYLSQAETMESQQREKKIAKAIELSSKALDYSLNYDDMPSKIVQRMMILARAYFADGRENDAYEMLQKAAGSAKTEDNLFLQAEIELINGKFQLEQSHYREAEGHFQQAIEMAKEGQYIECLQNAYQGAYDASRHFNLEHALHFYEQSVALKDSIFNERQQELIRDYQARYDLAEKEHQLEIQQKNNRLMAAEIIILVVLTAMLLIILVILVRLIHVRKKQNETLERLYDTQNRILSVASHDVKTSVLAQNMVLKMVNEHFDNMERDELKEKLALVKTGSDELKDKLYNILHWIYGELGKEPIPPESFKPLSVIEEGLALHAEELKTKRIKLVKDIPAQLTCYDNVNVVSIVFQNLISNAIKFTPQEGEIRIRTIDEDKQVWLEVADNGIGISPERLQQLMHDTVQPNQGTMGEKGSGIGLFVSRQLMVKNGGLLVVESVEGQGTTIRFNVKKPKQ